MERYQWKYADIIDGLHAIFVSYLLLDEEVNKITCDNSELSTWNIAHVEGKV